MRTLRNVIVILLVGIAALFGLVTLSGYALRSAAEGDETLIYLMTGGLIAVLVALRVFARPRA